MPQNHVKLFFEDLSLTSTYELLEWGKNDEELKDIASRKGLKIPSKDLSIFKCKYGMVDKENRNKCTLPRKEVKKALKSLNGKAIDKDHLRKSTIGYWLDAELEDNDIIAYGAFWKSNFPEDYDEIKRRMSEGKMKISFEAWGDRIIKENGSYDLIDIEFAGGALLFDSEPAFPDAEVMEFSTNRVLEFAKIVEDKDSGKEKTVQIEKSDNVEAPVNPNMTRKIVKIITEELETTVEIPDEKENTIGRKRHLKRTIIYDDNTQSTEESDLQMIDRYCDEDVEEEISSILSIILEDNYIDEEANKQIEEIKSLMINMSDEKEKKDLELKIAEIEKSKKLTYKERQNISDDDFAVVVTVKNKKTGDPRKIRMFPIKDPAHVRNALARLPQATETLKKLGVSVETVKNKILKRARELNMTDVLKRHEGEVSTLMDELLKKYNKASIEEVIKFLETEISTAKEMSEKQAVELASKVQEITTRDAELATLKTEKEAMLKSIEESKLMVENSKLEMEKLKAEFATIKADLDARLAAEKAAIVKARKDEIGEYAKDMSDEDILNDLKFENAKLKKERDEAVKKASITTAGLEAGKVIDNKDELTKSRETVQAKAWQEKDKK